MGGDVQRFWQNHLFVAWWARKGTPRAPAGIVPFRQGSSAPTIAA
jgi:hypothetical protein